MKFAFSVIHFRDISLPCYVFYRDEKKNTHGGKGFFIKENISFTRRADLNISLGKNLKSSYTV